MPVCHGQPAGVSNHCFEPGSAMQHGQPAAYIRKASDVAVMAILAKKNWRKFWPKNGLKWPEIAKNFA